MYTPFYMPAAFAAYLLVAFILYRTEQVFFRNLIRHLMSTLPVTRQITALIITCLFVLLPIVVLWVVASSFFRIDDGKDNDTSRDFLERHYPEIAQNLDFTGVSIKRSDLREVMTVAASVVDGGIPSGSAAWFETYATSLREESKIQYEVTFNGKRAPLVITIEPAREGRWNISFFSTSELTAALDAALDKWCKPAPIKAEG